MVPTNINDIIKPSSDCREYGGFVLNNQLQVLVISDKDTDVSACSLLVQVGHLSDPENVQGFFI
jgi:secreted Zn-dependent insulinase-like peptidase